MQVRQEVSNTVSAITELKKTIAIIVSVYQR